MEAQIQCIPTAIMFVASMELESAMEALTVDATDITVDSDTVTADQTLRAAGDYLTGGAGDRLTTDEGDRLTHD